MEEYLICEPRIVVLKDEEQSFWDEFCKFCEVSGWNLLKTETRPITEQEFELAQGSGIISS